MGVITLSAVQKKKKTFLRVTCAVDLEYGTFPFQECHKDAGTSSVEVLPVLRTDSSLRLGEILHGT